MPAESAAGARAPAPNRPAGTVSSWRHREAPAALSRPAPRVWVLVVDDDLAFCRSLAREAEMQAVALAFIWSPEGLNHLPSRRYLAVITRKEFATQVADLVPGAPVVAADKAEGAATVLRAALAASHPGRR